jgi:hypothetical protein
MPKPVLRATVRPGAGTFFVLTLALTYAAWAPAALSGSAPHPLLFALGGISPSLWGIVLTYRQPREARRDFWSRVFDPRRVWQRPARGARREASRLGGWRPPRSCKRSLPIGASMAGLAARRGAEVGP